MTADRHMQEARELIDRLQAHVRLDRAYDPHLSDDAAELIATALDAAEKRGDERATERAAQTVQDFLYIDGKAETWLIAAIRARKDEP